MKFIRQLPSIDELLVDYSLSDILKQAKKRRIAEVQSILKGADNRKILLVGPCSADREDAVVDYTVRLAKLSEEVNGKLLILPRVYTSKPRTTSTGYKGMLHRPNAASNTDNILEGIKATRKMHLHVIESSGLFCVDEMLYPESIYYYLDLLVYVAVGARSVEDQHHRLTASGLELPVGMKNPTNGDMNVLLNSIEAAQHKQTLIYRGWEVETEGNPFAHAILRGYSGIDNITHPNYHYEDLCRFHDIYHKRNLLNPSVIIDCNHANSSKHADEQIRIAKEVTYLCRHYPAINKFVKGFMIESYLVDGCQLVGGGIYGKSITDPCIGWNKTEYLIKYIADKIE